jgi:hypothetical protein
MQARKFAISFLSLEYFESVVGPEVRDAIPALGRYEAVCVGPAFNVDEPVIVKLSHDQPTSRQSAAAN